MQRLRLHVMKHVRLTLVVLALALTMKALVPAGIMPSTGNDRFLTVTICADASGSPRQMQIAIADREDGPGDQPEAADSAAPCAFSGLGHAALGGADPVLLAAVLAFILALGFAPPHALRLRQHALLRPPPRGPPLRAV